MNMTLIIQREERAYVMIMGLSKVVQDNALFSLVANIVMSTEPGVATPRIVM